MTGESGNQISQDWENEMVEHVTILEYNRNIEDFEVELTEGDRVIVGGARRRTARRCDEREDFINVGEAVAIIELYQPIKDGEVTDWCNSPAGKLALAHWFDVADPEDVVME